MANRCKTTFVLGNLEHIIPHPQTLRNDPTVWLISSMAVNWFCWFPNGSLVQNLQTSGILIWVSWSHLFYV